MQKTTVIKIITEIKANYRYTYKDITDNETNLIISYVLRYPNDWD